MKCYAPLFLLPLLSFADEGEKTPFQRPPEKETLTRGNSEGCCQKTHDLEYS